MKKNTIKLNEGQQLRNIVAASVKKALNEGYNQEIVDEAIQAIFSIREKIYKAQTKLVLIRDKETMRFPN